MSDQTSNRHRGEKHSVKRSGIGAIIGVAAASAVWVFGQLSSVPKAINNVVSRRNFVRNAALGAILIVLGAAWRRFRALLLAEQDRRLRQRADGCRFRRARRLAVSRSPIRPASSISCNLEEGSDRALLEMHPPRLHRAMGAGRGPLPLPLPRFDLLREWRQGVRPGAAPARLLPDHRYSRPAMSRSTPERRRLARRFQSGSDRPISVVWLAASAF